MIHRRWLARAVGPSRGPYLLKVHPRNPKSTKGNGSNEDPCLGTQDSSCKPSASRPSLSLARVAAFQHFFVPFVCLVCNAGFLTRLRSQRRSPVRRAILGPMQSVRKQRPSTPCPCVRPIVNQTAAYATPRLDERMGKSTSVRAARWLPGSSTPTGDGCGGFRFLAQDSSEIASRKPEPYCLPTYPPHFPLDKSATRDQPVA
jgi:hypothetical protein